MMVAAGPISDFVDRHPTVKMLALSFLLLIGVSLVAEGFDQHIPKGYIYFAMGFSVFVEMLNLRMRKKAHRSRCGGATARSTTRSSELVRLPSAGARSSRADAGSTPSRLSPEVAARARLAAGPGSRSLEISLLHLLRQIIRRAPREREDRQRRVLLATRS